MSNQNEHQADLGGFPDLRSGHYTPKVPFITNAAIEMQADIEFIQSMHLGEFPDLRNVKGPALNDLRFYRENKV